MKKFLLGLSLLSFIGGVSAIFIARDRGSPGLTLGGFISIGAGASLLYVYGMLDGKVQVSLSDKKSGSSAMPSPLHQIKMGAEKTDMSQNHNN